MYTWLRCLPGALQFVTLLAAPPASFGQLLCPAAHSHSLSFSRIPGSKLMTSTPHATRCLIIVRACVAPACVRTMPAQTSAYSCAMHAAWCSLCSDYSLQSFSSLPQSGALAAAAGRPSRWRLNGSRLATVPYSSAARLYFFLAAGAFTLSINLK